MRRVRRRRHRPCTSTWRGPEEVPLGFVPPQMLVALPQRPAKLPHHWNRPGPVGPPRQPDRGVHTGRLRRSHVAAIVGRPSAIPAGDASAASSPRRVDFLLTTRRPAAVAARAGRTTVSAAQWPIRMPRLRGTREQEQVLHHHDRARRRSVLRQPAGRWCRQPDPLRNRVAYRRIHSVKRAPSGLASLADVERRAAFVCPPSSRRSSIEAMENREKSMGHRMRLMRIMTPPRYQGGSVLNRKSCRYGSRLASSSVALPSKRMRPSCRTMNSARSTDAVSAGAIRTDPCSLTAWCAAM